jgi:peptide alpha-N-acetyltransferase
LSASELKKLKNKQKKQQLKAQQEKEKQLEIEKKKKELSKAKTKDDGGDEEKATEEELNPEKLEKCDNPLEECNRFLKPIEEFASQYLQTHMLAFEVYFRKNKFLLMLKSLKKITNFSDKSTLQLAKSHYYKCKFLIKYNKTKETLNETVRSVIDQQIATIQPNAENVAEINESFLKQNSTSYECCVEVAKVIYDLNPTVNQKRALDLVTDIDSKQSSIPLKIASQAFELVSYHDYFGNQIDEKLITDFRLKLKASFPHSNLFQSKEEQETEKSLCISNLSITPVPASVTSAQSSSGTNDITEKLAGATL